MVVTVKIGRMVPTRYIRQESDLLVEETAGVAAGALAAGAAVDVLAASDLVAGASPLVVATAGAVVPP